MKKFLKIFGITFVSLVAAVLIVASTAVWFIFTPEKLTPMVRNVAKNYITCPHTLGKVELTFFSTFPQFGLKIDELTLINPMQGAVSDTVLTTPNLVAKINIRALLKENAIVLDEFNLTDVVAHVFVDTQGVANYDVFVTDTIAVVEETATLAIPFDAIVLSKVNLGVKNISYHDLDAQITANLSDFTAQLSLDLSHNTGNGQLLLSAPQVAVLLQNEPYLENAFVKLELPFYADLNEMNFRLNKATLSLNEFSVLLEGGLAMPENGDINTDVAFNVQHWKIKPLLELLPESFAEPFADIDFDGLLSVSGKVIGTYNQTQMPLIDVNLILQDAAGSYSELPYKLYDVFGNIDAHLNLNDSLASFAKINMFAAKTGESHFQATGTIHQLMADMLCDFALQLKLNLPELIPLMPSDMEMNMKGWLQGNATAKFAMSHLDNMDFSKMKIAGKLNATDLCVYYDSIWVDTDNASVKFTLPNPQVDQKNQNFLSAVLNFDNLKYQQGLDLVADLQNAKFNLQTSNVVADETFMSLACEFAVDAIMATMDDVAGTLTKPIGKASVRINMKDTTALPYVSADIKMENLVGSMDTMAIDVTQPRLKIAFTGTPEDRTHPRIRIDYGSSALVASLGEYLYAQTKSLSLIANAKYDEKQEQVLLQWSPRISVDLQEGKIELADLPEDIIIPEIKFDYDNDNFNITDSRIVLGNSDFQLKGHIKNIGPWLSNADLLVGELDFVSNVTDVNQLMDLVSGFGDEDTTEPIAEITTQTAEEPNPFMVPKGVDIVLHTNVKQALVGEQIATNVGGNLYVQDGVLVLEEIGFVCEAAKMQLNATYKTPRKNHLYVGLIYHMVDVHIEELATLFPDIIDMVPMLSSFKGKGEFHLAGETYMDASYNLKTSTIRGACSVSGKDLVVMDGETFSTISKYLMFNKKTENVIDTLYAEIGVFKDKIDIYPLLVSIDKYQVALGGYHYLNMDVDYHISLIKPLPIGLDIGGNLDNMTYKVGKCKYAEDFRPKKPDAVETQNQQMRKIIRESLKRTVVIQSEADKN